MKIPNTSLSLRSRGTLSDGEPLFQDGRYILRGEIEWLLEGDPSEVFQVQQKLGAFADSLSEGLLILNFGNAVGQFTVPLVGRLNVISGKWGDQDFDRMLMDITEMAAGLPFASRLTGAIPYERSALTEDIVLYHAFVYLRYSMSPDAPFSDRLVPAFRSVLSEPHRLFASVRRDRRLFAVSRVDGRTIENIVSMHKAVERAPLGMLRPLANALGGYLPEYVDEPDVVIQIDTPENRLVLFILSGALGIVGRMREILTRGVMSAFRAQLVDQCNEIERSLRPIARNPFWQKIGDVLQVPTGSTVLQQRRGYTQIYRYFIKSRLSACVPLSEKDIVDLLESKDIAQLYELWSYFVLVVEVSKLLGVPSKMDRPNSDEMQISLRWEFETVWPNSTRVLYNPRFSRSRAEARYAYSVPLRPDFAVEVPDGANEGLHLFDAKFRVDRVAGAMAEAEEAEKTEEIKREERAGTFKIADLYKMHTYRDSIPRARSVWALYPGDQFTFFSLTGKVEDVRLVPETLVGVGAVPLVPSEHKHSDLQELLRRLLSC